MTVYILTTFKSVNSRLASGPIISKITAYFFRTMKWQNAYNVFNIAGLWLIEQLEINCTKSTQF